VEIERFEQTRSRFTKNLTPPGVLDSPAAPADAITMRSMTMAEPAEKLSADDLLPIAKKLPRGEQLRLARRLLEPETGTADDLLAKRRAGIGRYAGRGWIAEDFDAPLPPDIQKCFDGEDETL
jgi:hypothetical protein